MLLAKELLKYVPVFKNTIQCLLAFSFASDAHIIWLSSWNILVEYPNPVCDMNDARDNFNFRGLKKMIGYYCFAWEEGVVSTFRNTHDQRMLYWNL